MAYTLILFDADETLFDFKRSQDVALEQSLLAHGITMPFDVVKPVYNDINTKIWQAFEAGTITVSALKVERFRRLFEALDVQAHAARFSKTYLERLAEASFVYEGVPELLARLQRTHRMAIITNGLKRVQSKRVAQSEIHHFFDEIVISEAVQLVKPDPEIFRHTLEQLGHDGTQDVLMVGDSLSSDIAGGINAGLDTCWINPAGQPAKPGIQPTFELASVLDIETIL